MATSRSGSRGRGRSAAGAPPRGLPFADDAGPPILSVGQITTRIKRLLEDELAEVWVGGEVSGVTYAASGHVYFTLKDDEAQLGAVLWRSQAARLPFRLTDGLEVVCRGGVNVYPPHGKYQLIVQEATPRGEGALQLALRQLRAKLAAEGLFDEARKRPLPSFPRQVAFVTSPTGAAIRDFLEISRRRWPAAHVWVIPARVQGEGAAAEIVAGIRLANRLRSPPDVLVVGRGGGSLEDLWCFNDEAVVRAIHASATPVVSAVGHETDVTLVDLVADLRAATPSEAAERVFPSAAELRSQLRQTARRLQHLVRTRVATARAQLDALARLPVLRRPYERIYDLSRRVDDLEQRASRALRAALQQREQRLATLAAGLESLSPLAVLRRGYSLTTSSAGTPLRDAEDVRAGDLIHTRLARGGIVSRVEPHHPRNEERTP